MLIQCPECGKEISDKSDKCIHCGYPLQDKSKNICIVNGKEYDLSFLLDDSTEYKDKLIMFVQLTGCYVLADDEDNVDKIIETKIIPPFLNIITVEEYKRQHAKPHCPYCNSTNIKKISGTERVASIAALGIFSKKINKSFKCKNCGATW